MFLPLPRTNPAFNKLIQFAGIGYEKGCSQQLLLDLEQNRRKLTV
jgi:hypothetical protein